MSFSPRLLTVLSLLQFFIVGSGFLLTRGCLNLFDAMPPRMYGLHAPFIPPLARFVRTFGLWFLLVPVVWCVLAAVQARVARDAASVSLLQVILGALLTAGLATLFTYSSSCAFTAAFGSM